MDDKVKAVLDAYHARMREEEKVMRAPPATGAGDWRDKVLLAVGPDTGRLINILARSLKAPTILELGTSYGYSGIWLAEAVRATGGRLITSALVSVLLTDDGHVFVGAVNGADLQKVAATGHAL